MANSGETFNATRRVQSPIWASLSTTDWLARNIRHRRHSISPQRRSSNDREKKGTHMVCSRRTSAAVIAGFSLDMTSLAASAQQAQQRDYVPGQLIVGFKSSNDLDKAINELKETEKSGGISTRGATSSSVQIERLSETAAKLS